MIYYPLIARARSGPVSSPVQINRFWPRLLHSSVVVGRLLYHNNGQLRDLIASYYYIGLRCLSIYSPASVHGA